MVAMEKIKYSNMLLTFCELSMQPVSWDRRVTTFLSMPENLWSSYTDFVELHNMKKRRNVMKQRTLARYHQNLKTKIRKILISIIWDSCLPLWLEDAGIDVEN